MNRFLLEIHEIYTKIVKSANLIGFLNRLAVFVYFGQKLISQALDSVCLVPGPFWGRVGYVQEVGRSGDRYVQGVGTDILLLKCSFKKSVRIYSH